MKKFIWYGFGINIGHILQLLVILLAFYLPPTIILPLVLVTMALSTSLIFMGN